MAQSFSGLYLAESGSSNAGTPPDDLRLDVDGVFPQMAASGRLTVGNRQTLNWMARIRAAADQRSWRGSIRFMKPDDVLPATRVEIARLPANSSGRVRMQITLLGRRMQPKTQTFGFESRYFRTVDFEFDHTRGIEPTLHYATGSHPNRPRRLAVENLTVADVFERAGFAVTRSPSGLVQIPAAGDDVWSDSELNDAMAEFRSQRAQQPQWSLWVFTAGQHVEVPDADGDMVPPDQIGGVMFDTSGPLQRQGTAIFHRTFLSDPPQGERTPEAWVQRERFWCTCHEMGHAFNLAHPWEKSRGIPWIPQRNNSQARTFTNYPHVVRGGQRAFYQSFDFRFTDHELLFLRHAPAEFVEMGNVDFLDDHAAELLIKPRHPRQSRLKLQVRVNRNAPVFSYLEPVTLELKLKNATERPQRIDQSLLVSMDSLRIVVRKKAGQARVLRPFVRYRQAPRFTVLPPGESLYIAVFVSCGVDGWLIDDPGEYSVQAVLRLPGQDVVSNRFRLTVGRPTADEHRLESDYFAVDVGRVIALDGSRRLTAANATLERIADQLRGKPVAIHAEVALACASAMPSKRLRFDGYSCRVEVEPSDASAFDRLHKALFDEAPRAIETLGHIDYKLYCDWVTRCLETQAKGGEARLYQQKMLETMSDRRVKGRPIKKSILASIEKRLEQSNEFALV